MTARGGVKLHLIIRKQDITWKVLICVNRADLVISSQESKEQWSSNSLSYLPAVRRVTGMLIKNNLKNLQGPAA
jgi:hypothetical protein